MITKLLSTNEPYYGDQLNGVFSYKTLRAAEDSLIAWRGAAEVKEKMVDYEDVLNNDSIKAKEMVHFIMTIDGGNLREARLWQLVLMRQCYESIRESMKGSILWMPSFIEEKLVLDGDDIYVDTGKLSVSIATVSTNRKMMVHAGINVDDTDAPVSTFSLNKLKINPNMFAEDVLNRFEKEYLSVQKTMYKVIGVN